jgi:hypothetical protein
LFLCSEKRRSLSSDIRDGRSTATTARISAKAEAMIRYSRNHPAIILQPWAGYVCDGHFGRQEI